MQTSYEIIKVDGTRLARVSDLPAQPHIQQLHEILRPALDHAWPEHVRVLVGETYLDMFVDEDGMLRGLPVNDAATAIYRNNMLTFDPERDPESLPCIYGTAILFSRPVWF